MAGKTTLEMIAWTDNLPEGNFRKQREEASYLDDAIADLKSRLNEMRKARKAFVADLEKMISRNWTAEEIKRAKRKSWSET